MFNIYGPCMHPNHGRIVSNFVVHALKDEEITLHGDGSQTRSFWYCDVMFRMIGTFADQHGPIKIDHPNQFASMWLAKPAIESTGSKSKLVYRPLPSVDPKHPQLYITKARGELGWRPKIPIHDG